MSCKSPIPKKKKKKEYPRNYHPGQEIVLFHPHQNTLPVPLPNLTHLSTPKSTHCPDYYIPYAP